jgi:hypothetical protein
MNDRDEMRRAMDEIAKEKMRRGIVEDPVFAGNRQQRRQAKRAHDRMTRGRRTSTKDK